MATMELLILAPATETACAWGGCPHVPARALRESVPARGASGIRVLSCPNHVAVLAERLAAAGWNGVDVDEYAPPGGAAQSIPVCRAEGACPQPAARRVRFRPKKDPEAKLEEVVCCYSHAKVWRLKLAASGYSVQVVPLVTAPLEGATPDASG